MICQYNIKRITLVTVLLFTMGIYTAAACFAGEDENKPMNETTTSQIMEIPGLGSGGDRDFVGEVAEQYDFIGTVDGVQEDGIVIDDSYFKKAPDAKISGAGKGNRVGIFLNSKGEMTLCEPVKKERR